MTSRGGGGGGGGTIIVIHRYFLWDREKGRERILFILFVAPGMAPLCLGIFIVHYSRNIVSQRCNL